MNSKKLYITSLVMRFLPETSGFQLKNCLLRWCGAKIGNNVRITSSVRILGISDLTIGDDTWIGHEAMIICSAPVKIGSKVDIAPRCYIGTGSHEINYEGERVAGNGYNAPIQIGNGTWLGANSTILPGCTVGHQTLVAAGSVVVKNVPSYSMVAGVPAKIIKELKLAK